MVSWPRCKSSSAVLGLQTDDRDCLLTAPMIFGVTRRAHAFPTRLLTVPACLQSAETHQVMYRRSETDGRRFAAWGFWRCAYLQGTAKLAHTLGVASCTSAVAHRHAPALVQSTHAHRALVSAVSHAHILHSARWCEILTGHCYMSMSCRSTWIHVRIAGLWFLGCSHERLRQEYESIYTDDIR